MAKRFDCSNTCCIAREKRKARRKKDKEDGTSEDFEEVNIPIHYTTKYPARQWIFSTIPDFSDPQVFTAFKT
ncbi:MAG: hypothetical protein IJ055_04880 [Oscillospiraceae bacterium]|nr:hypothetical protein [Oscillospiraceae bacterium]